MRAFVAGAEGQLGRALVEQLGAEVAWSGGRGELDVRARDAVARAVAEARPDVVLNASAYNRVDAAETEADQAFAVNAIGPRHLAEAARAAGALMVHVSSDYVFDGEARRPYAEDDPTNPLGVYGLSKLAGERLVQMATERSLVVRTSAVFAAGASRDKGGSFIERILARARSGQPLRVVADQVLSPTYAPDLAEAVLALVRADARGVVHVSNDGSCSWHELAMAALERAGLPREVEPIRASDLGAPARRPAYSVLSNERYRSLGLPPRRHWREAVEEFFTTAGLAKA